MEMKYINYLKINEDITSSNDVLIAEFLDSISKFKISGKDYKVIYKNDEPNNWLQFDKKEIDLIKLILKINSFDFTNFYDRSPYIILSNILPIDLVKVEDDYYYISITRDHFNNKYYYYRLDQLSELREFLKKLDVFNKKYQL